MNFEYRSASRSPILSYKTTNAHVIAQFICAGIGDLGPDSLPKDPYAYAQAVLASPDYAKASSSPQIYGLHLGRAVYTPTRGEFLLKIFVLAVLLVGIKYAR